MSNFVKDDIINKMAPNYKLRLQPTVAAECLDDEEGELVEAVGGEPGFIEIKDDQDPVQGIFC